MTKLNKFETDDLGLAAYLCSVGATLSGIKHVTSSKGLFVFDNAVQEIIDGYYMGNASVEPITFHNKLKALVTAVRKSAPKKS